jgi:hypothetical protein
MEDELGKMCNKELCQSLHEDTEANSVNPRPELLISTPRRETRTFRIRTNMLINTARNLETISLRAHPSQTTDSEVACHSQSSQMS